MPVAGSLLSPAKRPKWRFIAIGVGLIVVTVALTVAWQILAAPDQQVRRELAGLRWVAYFFGSLLFLLLIARLARRCIDLTATRYQLPRQAFTYQGVESLMVKGDPAALETAVLNLLDNAVKYSKDRVEVEVDVWGNGDGQAHLRVRDHGIG